MRVPGKREARETGQRQRQQREADNPWYDELAGSQEDTERSAEIGETEERKDDTKAEAADDDFQNFSQDSLASQSEVRTLCSQEEQDAEEEMEVLHVEGKQDGIIDWLQDHKPQPAAVDNAADAEEAEGQDSGTDTDTERENDERDKPKVVTGKRKAEEQGGGKSKRRTVIKEKSWLGQGSENESIQAIGARATANPIHDNQKSKVFRMNNRGGGGSKSLPFRKEGPDGSWQKGQKDYLDKETK